MAGQNHENKANRTVWLRSDFLFMILSGHDSVVSADSRVCARFLEPGTLLHSSQVRQKPPISVYLFLKESLSEARRESPVGSPQKLTPGRRIWSEARLTRPLGHARAMTFKQT